MLVAIEDFVRRHWFWVGLGALILFIGGAEWFVMWLTPGVPPPGPFG